VACHGRRNIVAIKWPPRHNLLRPKPTPSKDLKRELLIWSALAAAAAATTLWLFWPLLSETAYGHVESERQVRHVVGRLWLGAPGDAVNRMLAEPQYSKLIVRHRGITDWHIGTPSTLGATDWRLTLRFGDAGLSCVVVGTADDWSRAPADAPAAPCVP
jgi:hypothetical protein